MRTRFCSVARSLRSDSSFRVLNFMMPEASSKTRRRSSERLLRISSTRPWPTIEYPSRPSPVSMKSIVMSLRRHVTLLMRYSLSPER